MKPTTEYKHLAPNPKSSYRQLFIKGTKFTARQLYGQHVNAEEPRTAEELAEDFGVPLEAVREAIAYCASNPPEIALDQAEDDALMEARGMNDPNYKYHPQPKPLSIEQIAEIRRRFEP